MTNPLTEVPPELLERWLADGSAACVDVREDFEHAAEHIDGAHNHPLSTFDPDAIRADCGDTRIVFHCRSGKRSAEAAGKFRQGEEDIFHLTGGIEAWKSSGRATQHASAGPRIDIMRQVQMVAGSLVLLGVILGTTVSPWFLALSGFVGAGLFFAGASGWCGMAKLLAKMPWNASCSSGSCSR